MMEEALSSNLKLNPWTVAGCFSLLSCLLSFSLMTKHLRYYANPRQQKLIIRIVLMVPIYAVASWLSLCYKDRAVYIDLARDCYEAFVIYSFVALLIDFSGGEAKLKEALKEHGVMHHMFPFGCLPSFRVDGRFLRICRQAVLQYVLVKPSMAVLAIVLDHYDMYDEGHFSWEKGYAYISLINNLSVTIALYGLVYFYHATCDHLSKFKPLNKLLCIKGVLFLSFWQGVVISILAHFNLIHETITMSLDQVETGLQDFLLCAEMLLAAVAHGYAYGVDEYAKAKQVTAIPVTQRIRDVFSFSDVVSDVGYTFSAEKKAN